MTNIISYAISTCSLGTILVANKGSDVCCIILGDNQKILLKELHARFPKAEFLESDSSKIVNHVADFVEHPSSKWSLPLDLQGTPFQKSVWKALQKIPAGKTATYLDIATKIGQPKAVRAVAQACGANPVAVAIPCHRVVRSDGGLSGYRWGVERKAELLKREGVVV